MAQPPGAATSPVAPGGTEPTGEQPAVVPTDPSQPPPVGVTPPANPGMPTQPTTQPGTEPGTVPLPVFKPEYNDEGIPIEGQSTCQPSDSQNKKPPAEILSIKQWGLNIPFDGDGNDGSGKESDWIQGSSLNNYFLPFYFESNFCGTGILFRAHTGGATTDGSGFPRSELREMKSNGSDKASWSSTSGRHLMRIVQSVNHLPREKPDVVVGQIHDSDDDVTVFRVEGRKLWVTRGDDKLVEVDPFVNLGMRFEVQFIVENGRTEFWYNKNVDDARFTLKQIMMSDGSPDYEQDYSGAYFKAGAYTQSACDGKNKVEGESCDAYAEVEIFDLEVKHD